MGGGLSCEPLSIPRATLCHLRSHSPAKALALPTLLALILIIARPGAERKPTAAGSPAAIAKAWPRNAHRWALAPLLLGPLVPFAPRPALFLAEVPIRKALVAWLSAMLA